MPQQQADNGGQGNLVFLWAEKWVGTLKDWVFASLSIFRKRSMKNDSIMIFAFSELWMNRMK
jgi:hypothetical protein